MWSSLVKIQYTELKLSCGNDHVVKNSIYINSDLWPNDPKINRVLPLPQGNHVAKFGKDPIYRTKVIVQKPVWTPTRHNQSHSTASLRRAYKKEEKKWFNMTRKNLSCKNIFVLDFVFITCNILANFPAKNLWT